MSALPGGLREMPLFEAPLTQLATLLVLGVAAQWLAARARWPAILVLLITGYVAGPVAGWIRPHDQLLLPLTQVGVALILFEAGLTLKLDDLGPYRRTVLSLCVFGSLTTWIVATLAARPVFGLDTSLSALLAAALVVTGPSVVDPLLLQIRPFGPTGPILKGEGVALDPAGAALAVLSFVFVAAQPGLPTTGSVLEIGRTAFAGVGLGVGAALLLAGLLWRCWIPDYLQNATSLILVVAVCAAADALQPESGLLAATAMGLTLANLRTADVRHIVELKENFRVLLVGIVFVVLAARLDPADLKQVLAGSALFVAILVLVVRPLSVLVATLGSRLATRDRLFLMCAAPRGIVAAALSSLFALQLGESYASEAQLLVPITFLVMIGTVVVYRLGAPVAARALGVAIRNPQGLLIVGAQAWTRALARVLRQRGIPVLLVDNNRHKIAATREEGLPTYSGSILAEYVLDEIDLGGLGRLMAATPNDWVNAMAVLRFGRVFGANECYQLPPRQDAEPFPGENPHLHGRWLFGKSYTYAELSRRFGDGATIEALPLTEPYDPARFREKHGERAVPLCFLAADNHLVLMTAEDSPQPAAGDLLVAMVPPAPARPPGLSP